MDPNKQDALNNIENSIYRTAFKLRSVQTLCQLDLIDSSLIQHVLLRQRFWEARESSLSVQQLGQVLQELFQRAKVETTGEPHPRASELTLSLLRTIYDSRGTGSLQLTPVAAALIALSGDSPLTKYRALFQLYAENKGGYDHEARMTRRVLRNLLTDLQQIPAVVGESRALCSVESATRGCFQGVLSPTIKEEKFLCWVQSEPLILLWLPTCHRLSASEMLPHPVRCSICRAFPIMGLRYRCLKCLDYNLCQMCFFSGLHNTSHQQSHPVVEHGIQVSAKENTKFLFGTLKNNLLRGRYRRRDAMARQRLLDQGNTEHRAWFSIQYDGSNTPVHVRLAGPAEAAALGPSEYISRRISQAQQIHGNKAHHQAVISIRNELWRTRESVNTLHRERRFFKKQLNHCKDKLQAIYTSQEEKNLRFEAKIHQLTANQNGLWTKLQQLRQDLQTTLQPHHPSPSSCQNMESKVGHSSAEQLLEGRDPSQRSIATENGSDGEPLPMSAMTDRSLRSQANTKHALPSSESSVNRLQSVRSQNPAQKTPVEIPRSLPGWQQRLPQDVSPAAPTRIDSLALASVRRRATTRTKERRDEQEEEELQELLTKLLDTFGLERPSGPQSSENTDLYGAAERVCRAFSALMDQITLPKLK
ncbi:dystrotelin [Ochotona curzoniae]|uniref:dystrotelin n=1 Tax=Ochotona curzoniae TaxID=130825 RepID=UPI001B350EC1|nr:dystrotelin [Ochotona curzoniae]